MKIIRKIFFDDVKNLAKNFFALVIAIGVCFLPALYAWFNIYSNWDPYANTGALKIAAISLDKGFSSEGKYENVGESVIEELHDNHSVDWQFVTDEQQAIDGVYDGSYYAAIVIGEDFTYNMYNVFTEGADKPTLTFYQNQKKNPVATKISDTVVGTLETNINEAFIEVVVNKVFKNVNEAYEIIEEQGGVDGSLEKLKAINDQLIQYQLLIDQTISSNQQLEKGLQGAKEDTDVIADKALKSAANLDQTNKDLAATQVTLNDYKKNVDQTLDDVITTLDNMEAILSNSNGLYGDVKEIEKASRTCLTEATALKTKVDALNDATLSADIQKIVTDLTAIEAAAIAGTMEIPALAESVKGAADSVRNAKDNLTNTVIPSINQSIDSLEVMVAKSSDLMRSINSSMLGLGQVFVALDDTVESADVSLEKTRDALKHISDKLTIILDKLEDATEDERAEIIVKTLTGDPDVYGKFFSEPVAINDHTIYAVANYGSAVTPFYTTLAIWVGGLILCAIIKVKPKKENYPEATPNQLFFGRYALFFVCAQFQALIIVLGNLLFFKVQCLHPGWFWFTCSVAATTFSLLIYSLVVTFGDVGKAIAVVVVVLQIAGSSGTYPIELLPEFFQKVYIFFPFPYAINAMRECTSGMYEMDYLVYILQLAIFIVVSLVIGLLIRVPFEELNHFFEERMEETEMM